MVSFFTPWKHQKTKLSYKLRIFLGTFMKNFGNLFCIKYRNFTWFLGGEILWKRTVSADTAQKMKFSIKDFFSKCDQIHRKCGFGHIYWRIPYWKTSWKTLIRTGITFKEIHCYMGKSDCKWGFFKYDKIFSSYGKYFRILPHERNYRILIGLCK